MQVNQTSNLRDGFLRSVKAHGGRPALEVSGKVLTYLQLFQKAASLAATLARCGHASDPPLTAVFAHRSVTAFAGVLGVLLYGHGYVPLNRSFPPERTRTMFQLSGCRALIVDTESFGQLDHILKGLDYDILVILPEQKDTVDLARRWPRHRFIGSEKLAPHWQWRPEELSSDSVAYLLFTSGSTGLPKGVMTSHRSVRCYIDFIVDRFSIHFEDRFSQLFDMTFDPSVADMFVAWERGACVCCPSNKLLINPGPFINEARLTIWFSVPSTAAFMKRLGALKPGTYPHLRVSMFAGEALPVESAKNWADAAPNSEVVNLYGPTELTITCTYYHWDAVRSPSESVHGLVPIGTPFPGMRALVVDESLAEVAPGKDGELLMTGPQLALGYWNDPARTAAAFLKPPGRDELYYRTGDRVRKASGNGPLIYLGRVDHQIKIRGHRVEPAEIEEVVREESGIDGVVALGWPTDRYGPQGVEVFLLADSINELDLKDRVAKRLPVYMLPRRYHCLPQFPLNSNGKYDRGALTNHLETLA